MSGLMGGHGVLHPRALSTPGGAAPPYGHPSTLCAPFTATWDPHVTQENPDEHQLQMRVCRPVKEP